MRPAHAAAAAAILILMATAIVAGGHRLAAPADEIVIDLQDVPDLSDDGLANQPGDGEASTGAISGEQEEQPSVQSRAIDPQIIAPPPAAEAPLERAEPRPPLSELSLALPPKPKAPDQWKGIPLFQPLVTAAGSFQAKGYMVVLSGVAVVDASETCTDAKGEAWPCGTRARGAFRSFLRGRAPVCAVPPEAERDAIVATCHIGKQDIGAWLVANGWARAAPDGPYAEMQETARKAGKGIFGAAPDLSGLPPAPVLTDPPSVDQAPMGASSGSILDLSGEPATPPVLPPAPVE